MKSAKNHPKEHERVQALKDLNILDTISEQEFDEITLIASQICQTPIALISLVDDKRQWFKSKVGLSAPETPKEIAFCSHAILQDDVFVVTDSAKDDRFHDNPLVTGAPSVQFYAGAPLLDPVSNLPIGTLCVIDNKAREINQSQIESLKALSNQINKLLDLRNRIKDLSFINEKMYFQKTAFDNMSEGVVLQDSSGKIIDFNKASLIVLELSAEQMLGKTSMDEDWCSIREDGSKLPGNEHPAMLTLASGKPNINFVMGIKIKNAHEKWIRINSTPIFLSSSEMPTHVVSTFNDITNEKVAQQSLIYSSKMTSLGEMAGGVAHEINTPLAIILSSAQQVRKYFTEDHPSYEKLVYKIDKIESTAERISQIVRGLRTFSRNSSADSWEKCSLNQIIQDTLALCKERFSVSGVKIHFIESKDQYVHGIPTQISQIILNLLNNAFDAVAELDEKWVQIEVDRMNDNIHIRVTDSGNGIPAEVVNKLMQPFFTTKKVGKGTGLGLSISKGIAEMFRGELCYKIHNGKTSFVLTLPVADKTM